MKLYNRTPIPDDILRPMLVMAGQAVGARTNTVVKVNPGRYSCSGAAVACSWTGIKGRAVDCDGGYFRLSVPLRLTRTDPLEIAERIYSVAVHEWGHIRDDQAGGRHTLPWAKRGPGGRRPPHDQRPEEIRANEYREDALKALAKDAKRQDAILNLALWLEENLTRLAEARTAKTHERNRKAWVKYWASGRGYQVTTA